MRQPINKFGWRGHASFGLHAFAVLPQWQREMVRPDMSPEALDQPYLPQAISTPGEKMGYMCTIMDLVYHEACRSYATLPDGRWIPHGPPDTGWQWVSGTGGPPDPKAALEITELLLKRTIKPMREGDWEEAIRHAGALGHFLQEPYTPGHAMDNDFFHRLFPDPDPTRHIRLHHAFDAGPPHIEDPLPPKLMGTTVAEAAYRLQVEVARGIRSGMKHVPEIIRSYYQGEPLEARETILAPQARLATFVTASAWHTAFCIAFNRFEATETAALTGLDLTTVPHYFLHHCQYTDVLPGCFVQKGRKIPMHVWIESGDGEKQEQCVKHGFGMGGHMGIKWYVRGDIFPRLQLGVGLASRHTEGQCARTRCRFSVQIDTEVNRTYSEDMLYGGETVAEIELQPGTPVQQIDVNIEKAASIILVTRCEPQTDPGTGEIVFYNPHVGVCEPRLKKS